MSNYSLYDRITFGKHEGDTIKFIIDNDKGYFFWLVNNTKVRFGGDVWNYIKSRTKECGEDDEEKYVCPDEMDEDELYDLLDNIYEERNNEIECVKEILNYDYIRRGATRIHQICFNLRRRRV